MFVNRTLSFESPNLLFLLTLMDKVHKNVRLENKTGSRLIYATCVRAMKLTKNVYKFKINPPRHYIYAANSELQRVYIISTFKNASVLDLTLRTLWFNLPLKKLSLPINT